MFSLILPGEDVCGGQACSNVPSIRSWMDNFYRQGGLVKESVISRLPDGLYVAWHDDTKTGFVFGERHYTGADYLAKLAEKKQELKRAGAVVRMDAHSLSLSLGSFMYSMRGQHGSC